MLFIVFLDVFKRNVHVVKPLDVGANQSDPILSHIDIPVLPFRLKIVKLLRNFFNSFQEALYENFFVLRINNALQVDVYEEVSTFTGHVRVTVLDTS